MIFVMLHDLHFNGISLLRQQSQLSEVGAARSELVFRIVAVLSWTQRQRVPITLRHARDS